MVRLLSDSIMERTGGTSPPASAATIAASGQAAAPPHPARPGTFADEVIKLAARKGYNVRADGSVLIFTSSDGHRVTTRTPLDLADWKKELEDFPDAKHHKRV